MINPTDKVGFLFDLDGVLIDSERQYSFIWAQLNREFPTGIENLEQVIKGCTLTKILNDHYKTDHLRVKVAQRLHELENKMHYEFLPFAQEFLEQLNQRNISCALVTSSDNKKINHLLEELPKILSYFKFVVTGDLVKSSKPSPEGYLLGAEKINVKPRNCVVFEDSLQGVMAGENAGAYVIGVKGTIPEEELIPHTDRMIENFSEIILDELILTLIQR